MSNGGQGVPTPLMNQVGVGMQQAASAGQTVTPMAGGSPMTPPQPNTLVGASGTPPTAGGNQMLPFNSNVPNTGTPADPYSAFLTALQQIQQASPIASIGQATTPPKKSSQAEQNTMHETGVG